MSETMPSYPTLFRLRIANKEAYRLVCNGVEQWRGLLQLRDGKAVKRIEAAGTAEELASMAGLASGLGELAWHAKAREFGAALLPFVVESLRIANASEGEEAASRSQVNHQSLATLIAELRWQGKPGGEALLLLFSSLAAFAQGLAAPVLGLLGISAAAEPIWQAYAAGPGNKWDADDDSLGVGLLWGLIDLGDGRAAGALAKLLQADARFYELYGFLARAGDEAAVGVLLESSENLEEPERSEAEMALLAIGHRLGAARLAQALESAARVEWPAGASSPPRDYDRLAETILEQPVGAAQEFFAPFYRGFTEADLEG